MNLRIDTKNIDSATATGGNVVEVYFRGPKRAIEVKYYCGVKSTAADLRPMCMVLAVDHHVLTWLGLDTVPSTGSTCHTTENDKA